RPPQWWLLLVAGVALAVMAGGGYWLASHPKELIDPPKLTKMAVLPPDGFALEGAASRQSFALSPDGVRLAFTAMDSSGEFSVFLRDFNSLEPRLVPGSEGAHTIFWPSDGRCLYLTAKGKDSTSSLIVSGIYKYTRNPMYVGFALVLFGWAAFLSNLAALALVPV